MKDTAQHVKSKLLKTSVLVKNPELRQFVPDTKSYSPLTMRWMLIKHGMIYIKPDEGRFGRCVMKAEAKNSIFGNPFWLYYDDSAENYPTLRELAQAVDCRVSGGVYLVQRGIHMLSRGGRPFDIRVVVQRTLQRRWEATGVVGRLAGPRRIVTNFYGGGSAHELRPLLAPFLQANKFTQFTQRLFRLSRSVAIQMQRSFPRIKEVGLDIALDERLHPWILEVNTRPDPAVFRALADQTMYKRIVRYARAYGKSV